MKVRAAVAWAAALSATAVLASAATASADPREHEPRRGPFSFAVIGDVPYGDAQIAAFPDRIAQINADPDVRLVDHLGDIKSGSSQCTDAYFALIRKDFDGFADPLVYTPGDNEWTDCHRPNNGGYDPLERLAAVRSVFFDRPGRSLGQHSVAVTSQAAQGIPENVSYRRAGVSFAAVHVVGSNNSMAPWTGKTAPTPQQAAEVLERTAASVELIRDTFADARQHRDRAVVLMMQADMFDPTENDPSFADSYAFAPIVQTIARESRSFRRPVYLFNGDSHVYNADAPLASGSPWLSFYGVAAPADNLRRVTVDGSTGLDDWLKVTVHPDRREVLSWTRVPFAP
ncbi:hypothetical protein ASD06_06865 [Angustibacter sp. Root456]|nr:hypothetical protein ASD06_06865 [Angustibacter sp. Root456]